jgi:hypothetical protein
MRSAEASHPNAGPDPTARAPDGFEILRRAKDVVVGLGDAYEYGEKLPGRFCQFDEKTGWPIYSMKDDEGPVPDGICKIDETAERGISVRQLLVMYELVKQRCVAEGWMNWAGDRLRPETVTLYDLNKYVIMPATQAHQCSYVELVTGVGEESTRRCPDGHVPMARTKVYQDESTFKVEEVSCTQCAKKLELGATYWVCHRCGGKHKLCGECAPAPAPVKCAKLQLPLWFVSHWYGRRRSLPQLANACRFRNRWGEPVFLFIACLLQHARDRYYIAGDDDSWLDIRYWVCAYANNQHAYAPLPRPPSQQWSVPAISRAWR